MSYIVVKTIKGRKYRYLQTSYRQGKRVRTKSVYLGAGGGLSFPNYGQPSDEVMLAATNRIADQAKAERQAHLDKLHQDFGLRVGPSDPVPVDKEAPAEAGAKEGAVAPSK
jgi:hypothetical protein